MSIQHPGPTLAGPPHTQVPQGRLNPGLDRRGQITTGRGGGGGYQQRAGRGVGTKESSLSFLRGQGKPRGPRAEQGFG